MNSVNLSNLNRGLICTPGTMDQRLFIVDAPSKYSNYELAYLGGWGGGGAALIITALF